jgi:hypothetical protein
MRFNFYGIHYNKIEKLKQSLGYIFAKFKKKMMDKMPSNILNRLAGQGCPARKSGTRTRFEPKSWFFYIVRGPTN